MSTIQGVAMAPSQAIIDGAYGKVTRHLIPFIFICYLFNYLDRVNVGFADSRCSMP